MTALLAESKLPIMKRLPLGIQTFAKLIQEDHYYVDKTEFVYKLANIGTYFFLSRPRRFGKSSFLDTIQEAYQGNEVLFKGLFLEKNWDWSKKYPVIKISFGSGEATNLGCIDMAVLLNGRCFIMEFKVNEMTPEGRALKQLKEKKYHEKYADYESQYLNSCTVKEIYLIGVEFNKTDRNITNFEYLRV